MVSLAASKSRLRKVPCAYAATVKARALKQDTEVFMFGNPERCCAGSMACSKTNCGLLESAAAPGSTMNVS
jgi:hypothetical protein